MMGRSELAEVEEQLIDRLIEHTPAPEEAARLGIRTTSGTTSGTPLMTLMRYEERAFGRYDQSKRILFCSGSRALRLTRALQLSHHGGAHTILSLDVRDLSPALHEELGDYAPDTIEGVPSFVVRAVEYMGGSGVVRLCVLFGERLLGSIKSLLELTWPEAEVRTLYLSTELGNIGTSCPHLPSLNCYHPGPGVGITLLNADATGTGELLVSKEIMPGVAIRDYRIGDTVRVIEGKCACGNTNSFEHLGRSGYDYIKVAGAMVRREELDRALARFRPYIDDYRAEVGERLINGKIVGVVIVRAYRAGGPVTPKLQKEIARDLADGLFLTSTQTLSELTEKELFLPLVFEYSGEPFSQTQKDVKLSLLRGD